MTATAPTTIVLNQVKCISTSGGRGKDEVYIHYKIDDGRTKRYPDDGSVSMGDGDTWDTDLYLTFNKTAVVELYDSETLGDQLLGHHTYTPSETQPEVVTVSNTDGAKYELSTEAST
ncbi:MAG: hypothetical protein ACXWE9_10415 [Methylobacter sp.]